MKKVININFQGNIIPIEESAYDILQNYSESLRRHFANEEGRDEIINDIETRISELFSERLKKGATCITEMDVNAVIDSMGRPEDFDMDADPTEEATSQPFTAAAAPLPGHAGARRLYRDENHKILGGVCSGLANYFGIDPVIVRIIALVCFSLAFIPYLILWIAVPSSAEQVIGSPRKRLFRDTDNKMIAGVCAGLSQYFGLNVWIPRILFLIPFISIALRFNHWFGWGFPHFLSLSFSPAATITYIILWILVPEAKTTTDKLEMQGKPVDLNSIKNTVQNDLNEFKEKAQGWSKDISGTAQKWGKDVSNAAQSWNKKEPAAPTDADVPGEAGNIPHPDTEAQQFANIPRKNSNTGLYSFARILSYIIIGLVAVTVIGILFSVGIAFLAVLPAKDFFIKDGWENILAWGTFFLFIWVPIIGIIIWFIRLITKKRGGSTILRGSFIGLWIMGWICLFGLLSLVGHDFSHSAHQDPVAFQVNDKDMHTLVVAGASGDDEEYLDWDDENFNDFMRYFGNDSLKMENVNLKLIPAIDSSYHVETVSFSNGDSKKEALQLASRIPFRLWQVDSVLYVPSYFNINKQDKFRNQRVVVKISIPIGRQIMVKENKWRHNFRISIGRTGISRYDTDPDYDWNNNVLYVMTAEGLKPLHTEDTPAQDSTGHNKDWQSGDHNNTDDEDNGMSNDKDKKETSAKIRMTPAKATQSAAFSMASLLLDKFAL